jgi:uncharacterized HAD superfamily protein
MKFGTIMGEKPYQIAFTAEKHLFLKDYDFFLEDRRQTALELVDKYSKTVFLIDSPWNKLETKPRIFRISSPLILHNYIDSLLISE